MSEKVQRKRNHDKPRKKVNKARFKYNRDELLSLYRTEKPLAFRDCLMTTEEAQVPCLSVQMPFRHSLGEEIQPGREKKLPEWYDLPIEEEFSKVDVKAETKTKIPESEEVPEWDEPSADDFDFSGEIKKHDLPSYSLNLLKYHRAIGNPFARTLIEFGQEKEGNVSMVPFTKPFEKTWFYKDPEQIVQGPFSTIDMFNWTIKGFFPENLEISLGFGNFFVPKNVFNHVMPISDSEIRSEWAKLKSIESRHSPRVNKKKNKQLRSARERKNKEATILLKDILGIPPTTNPIGPKTTR